MRYEHLLDPISDDQPCGPDLEAEGDDGFIDYYYDALARIPEKFFSPSGESFDRKTVDVDGEVGQIEELLARSVDLRLLVLEAQFQVLAGRTLAFCEVVQIIGRLIEARWTDVHPQVADGPTDRKNQLELLNSIPAVVLPLERTPLLKDGRAGEISLRALQLARGEKEARDDENVGDAGTMQAALRSAENGDAVAEMYAAIVGTLDAIKALKTNCMIADSGSFVPTLNDTKGTGTGLEEVLAKILEILAEARPDLAGEGEETDEEAGETTDGAEGQDADAGADATAAVSAAPRPAGEIPNHQAAAAALLTVELYFARCEPSAPGLLLIRQARQLVGKPLTEAIATLLPSVSGNAQMDFGSETGFSMDFAKMSALAGETGDVDNLMSEPEALPEYVADTRTEAMALVNKVESYFRQAEPSSPVPVLLFKAKNYMNRDFSAIVSELFAERS